MAGVRRPLQVAVRTANGHRSECPVAAGQSPEVPGHDFAHLGIGKAIPYGVYDVAHPAGWGAVGQDQDTAPLAVHPIARGWQAQGRTRYPDARDRYLVADGRGRSGSRVRRWKRQLQRFATASGLRGHVRHFPPGTSTWHDIAPRLFRFRSMQGRGRPYTPCETIVEWIGHTPTTIGLTVWAEWDQGVYPTGRPVTPAQMRALHLEPDAFQGQWNATISPESVSAIDG